MVRESFASRIELRIRSNPGITSYELVREFGTDARDAIAELYGAGIVRRRYDESYRTPNGRHGGWRYIHIAAYRPYIKDGLEYRSVYEWGRDE